MRLTWPDLILCRYDGGGALQTGRRNTVIIVRDKARDYQGLGYGEGHHSPYLEWGLRASPVENFVKFNIEIQGGPKKVDHF